MPWHPNHLFGQLENALQVRIGHVHAGFLGMAFADLLAPSAPDGLGERGGDILGQTHRFADLADRHARAIMDDRGAQPGAVAAVFPVEVLDHLLAPFVLEIDVDIGRLLALFGNEAVEQQLVFGGIDIGDAEAIADRRIGRAAPPLAQDRRIDAVAGEIDDILDGEEIAREVELRDQCQFALQRVDDMVGHTRWVAILRPPPGLDFEEFLWRHAVRIDFFRIFVA